MNQAAQRKRSTSLFAVLAVLGALALTSAVPGISNAQGKPPSTESTRFLGRLSDALAEVAEAARPAIVNISTTTTVTMNEDPFGNMFNDPFFRHFFGGPFDHGQGQRKYKSSALGSGVIISRDGYILTNNHVVKGADEIKVKLYDKREFTGKVVGTDPRTDLAVVKINAKDLPVIKIGDSGKLKTGDIVLAIGNPFGLNQTITMGIVSAVGRSNIGLADLEDFIQTDAAINPGNSGGALVNSSGELVGINTAIYSTSGGYMGIGFAIPSNMAKSVMESIIKHGKVIRGWLGVSIQDLTDELAKSLGFKQTSGALVSGVNPGSPADKGGLKRGDLITAMNGRTIDDATSLRNRVASTSPGTKITLTVLRNGKHQDLTVTLGEYHAKQEIAKTTYDNMLKGVTVEELTPSERDKLNLPESLTGVVVTVIAPDSPAQGFLQPNDVIQQVNRHDIRTTADYDQAAAKIKKHDTVLLLIYRDGASAYLTIQQ